MGGTSMIVDVARARCMIHIGVRGCVRSAAGDRLPHLTKLARSEGFSQNSFRSDSEVRAGQAKNRQAYPSPLVADFGAKGGTGRGSA